MDRKEFLSLLGRSAGTAVLVACVGCSKNTTANSTSPSGVDFTLDLSTTANAALLNNGGYVYANGIIVAKTLNGDFIAVQQICTHENFSIVYQGPQHRFYCDGHGATFSESGAVIGGPARSNLTQYKTELNGKLLRIHSA